MTGSLPRNPPNHGDDACADYSPYPGHHISAVNQPCSYSEQSTSFQCKHHVHRERRIYTRMI